MTSDSSTAADGGAAGTTHSQRNTLPSPWAQVVRGGGEPEPVAPRSPSASSSTISPEQNPVVSDQLAVIEPQTAAAVEAQIEASDGSINGNANGEKKSAWNKPSANGVVEGSNTPVMGAASWPALSELTRPLPKSLSFPSESSSRPASDGSVTVSQAPVISQPPQRPIRPNTTHHSNQNHTHSVRPRSTRRGGGAGAGGGSNRPQLSTPPPPPMPQPPTPPPMPPPYPFYEIPYGGFVPPVMDPQVRDQSPYNGNNTFGRPMGGVHDHSSNRRRNNSYGPRPMNNGHGGRRDHHDRGDWRGPRNHAPLQPPMVPPPPPLPRGFMPPPHMGPAPFIAPQPLRPYGNPMGYDMSSSFLYVPTLPPVADPYRGAPLLPRAAPPPPMFPPPIVDLEEPPPITLLNQIEYYFSDANLVKDGFLRSKMDEEGWVPVSVIAAFPRVQKLTKDIQSILNTMRDSSIVEVQGETLRRRNEWKNFLNLPFNNFPTTSTTQPLPPVTTTATSALESSLHNLTLNNNSTPVENTTKDTNNTHSITNASDSSSIANGEVRPSESFTS